MRWPWCLGFVLCRCVAVHVHNAAGPDVRNGRISTEFLRDHAPAVSGWLMTVKMYYQPTSAKQAATDDYIRCSCHGDRCESDSFNMDMPQP
jgi:hypothetical protein